MPVLPRDLPPLSLSSDGILDAVPLDKLPLLGSPRGTSINSKRTDQPRDLPPLSLSSDGILDVIPLDNLPLLASSERETAKREAAQGDAPLLRVSSESLLKDLPIEKLQLNPLQSSASKREALPLLKVDTGEIIDSVPLESLGLRPARSPASKRETLPLLKVDSGDIIDKLPLQSLGLGPPQAPGSKREALPDKPPPFVKVRPELIIEAIPKILADPSVVFKREEEEVPTQPARSGGAPLVNVNPVVNADALFERLEDLQAPTLPKSKLLDALTPKRAVLPRRPQLLGLPADSILEALPRNVHLTPDPGLSKRALLPRQNSVLIPAQYAGLNSGPAPGAVAGIVLGSVFGFLLIVWLLWLISNGGGVLRSSRYTEDEIIVPRHRSRSPGARRSHRSHRTEMTDRSPRRERVVRQERIVRDRSIPAPRETSRLRDTVIMDEHVRPERRVDGDDIVEVIEEHSSVGVPPPRRKTRRSSGYR